MAARVRAQLHQWRAIGASPQVLDWIKNGVRLRWRAGGPPKPFNHGEATFDPTESAFIDKEVARCLATGAWEPATSSKFVSRAFLVPKPGGGFRLVVDLRTVNAHCVDLPCRYETLKTLRRLARPEDYLFSFDLSDGYHCVGIAPEHRQYLTFSLKGVLYQCAALPFGWSGSPFVFTKVMRSVVGFMRSPAASAARAAGRAVPLGPQQHLRFEQRLAGVRLLPYLDDFLFMVEGQAAAIEARDFVARTLDRLGLQRNIKKGQWEPAQSITHLGLGIDTRSGLFIVTPKRVAQLKAMARGILCRAAAHRGLVPARVLASFCGLAQAAYLAVPPARFFTRSLYDVLETKASWSSSVRIQTGGRGSSRGNSQAWMDLQWWASFPPKWNGAEIWATPTEATLYSDASDFGWGAKLVAPLVLEARGPWTPEEAAHHITWKEMRAVRYAIESFLPHLAGRKVGLLEDNQGVDHILHSSVSKTPLMQAELRPLWWLLCTHNIALESTYVRSADNLADGLSRHDYSASMRLLPSLFRALDARWGPHTIDRFASYADTQLPLYNSATLDPHSAGVNGLAQDWAGSNSWVFPPVELISRVVFLLRNSPHARATVVVPYWRAQAWFTDLALMASSVLLLGSAEEVLLRDYGPPELPLGVIAAFRVEGRPPSSF